MIRRVLCIAVGIILAVSVYHRSVHTSHAPYTFTGLLQYAETLEPPEVSIPLIDLSSWPDWIRWFGESLNGIIRAVNGVTTFVSSAFYFLYSMWEFLNDPRQPV